MRVEYFSIFWIIFVEVGLDYGDCEGWFAQGQRLLNAKLTTPPNDNVAKNVIIFVGDGMGLSTVTASRIYKGQKQGKHGEETVLSFEEFPHLGLTKTYNVDYQVADSAGTATALLAGIKTRFGVVGANQQVVPRNCSSLAGNEVKSIIHWSQEQNKSTGIVTTTRLTHASPAAAYAHSPWRSWEVDETLPVHARGHCEDIALQLITRNQNINVLLGGGRAFFVPRGGATDPEYPDVTGVRRDGRDLIQEWTEDKRKRDLPFNYVWNDMAFQAVDPLRTDYLLGLFEPSHMHFELDRKRDVAGEPSLAEMTTKAIKVLRKSKNGYFLFVEGGRIDHAHHYGNAKRALEDTLALEEAVRAAVRITNNLDTLIVVTADHSHTLNIGGYPARGNDILGLLDPNVGSDPPLDGHPATTLTYVNGPGMTNRSQLLHLDTTDDDFLQPVLIPQQQETHSGEDVAVYARGPMSHLFSGTYEQNYVAHAMAYASCVGDNLRHCSRENGHGDIPRPPVDRPLFIVCASNIHQIQSYLVVLSVCIQYLWLEY